MEQQQYSVSLLTAVVELISSAIGDVVQGIYHESSSSAEEGTLTVASWEDQTFLSHGALLAKSCQAAMKLARHGTEAQNLAFQYGKHLALGHKLNSDLQPFVKSGSEPAVFSLDSAPLVFHRQIVGPERWRQQLKQVQNMARQIDYAKQVQKFDFQSQKEKKDRKKEGETVRGGGEGAGRGGGGHKQLGSP
ncbi:All trans-polyprenyl-diphosphate synthase PDSS2 [Labeo rohita]|uniref:All trans-polyprenyl-diphosphate synthase PDSS2 n=1 Tax=Labeo rohita TaxID=84645 RepID=A0ABQ8M7W9_LABRO|nr:All trans-polyprenyl-diphosphate synthase PDSS2 [Labeo rohita]